MAKRRVGKYPLPFRQVAVEQMKDCPNVSALAKELGIDQTILYQWQRQMEHSGEGSASVTSPVREVRKQVRELKRVLAEKTLGKEANAGNVPGKKLGASWRFYRPALEEWLRKAA